MKKTTNRFLTICFLTMIIVQAENGFAQSFEMCGFAGYQLAGQANLYDGEFRINNAMNYGGKLALALAPSTFAEFSYMRSDTEGRFYSNTGILTGDAVEFSSNYFQLGGVREVDLGKVKPYGTVALGLTWWDPKVSSYDSKTQFSATVGAGLKIWLSDLLGIRLQGSMLLPMVWNGAGFGCGIGTGGANCGANVYSRITPFQGEFSGGIMIRISPN